MIENLGGPRIIARTIVDAALNTEDRPDGYETYGSGETQEADDNSQSREYSGPLWHSRQRRVLSGYIP